MVCSTANKGTMLVDGKKLTQIDQCTHLGIAMGYDHVVGALTCSEPTSFSVCCSGWSKRACTLYYDHMFYKGIAAQLDDLSSGWAAAARAFRAFNYNEYCTWHCRRPCC